MINVGDTGKAYKRNGDYWYSFIITRLTEDLLGDVFIEIKILDGDEVGKYSIIMNSELDSSIVFDKK